MKHASFLMKLAVAFYLMAIVCGFVGWCAWIYCNAMFSPLGYGTRCAIPLGFWCAAAGFLSASGVSFLLDVAGNVKTYFTDLFLVIRSKDDNHA